MFSKAKEVTIYGTEWLGRTTDVGPCEIVGCGGEIKWNPKGIRLGCV
jgi:hypothetical protein